MMGEAEVLNVEELAAQDRLVREALRGLPVHLIAASLRRVVRWLPFGAIVETTEGEWWVLSRWGVTWVWLPLHPMDFLRAGYPSSSAEKLFRGEKVSEKEVLAERAKLEKEGA